MKIVDVDVYTVDPSKGGTPNSIEYPDIWTFVRIRTDEGAHGWGECTNFPGNGSLMIADAIHHLRPWIIGEDASDINAMWHRIFRKAAYLGKHLEYSVETPQGVLFVVDHTRAIPLAVGTGTWITFGERGVIVVPA